MKTVKEELQDAIDLNLSQRELCRICGNALAEIERLEKEKEEEEIIQEKLWKSFS